MKTEREAFDLWFKKNFHDLHESICCGDLVAKNYKKAMFKSWCASASREGYKLVPLEPTEAMLEALEVGFKPDYEGGSYDSHEGYEAMMGLSE